MGHFDFDNHGINLNDVVQLDPEKTTNKNFAACFMTVTKVYSWGIQGYVQAPGVNGQAYYRATWDTFEKIGKAIWSVENEDGE